MRQLIPMMLVSVLFASPAWDTNWGPFKDDGCAKIKNGVAYRQYSAILWNIPWGHDWAAACRSTPGAGPTTGLKAVRCPQAGGHQWGEFEVRDASCQPHWGDFKDDGCVAKGVRQYSSILWDIPAGVSWESACREWPADISGPHGSKHFDRGTRCKNAAGHMWGEFDYPDSSCR